MAYTSAVLLLATLCPVLSRPQLYDIIGVGGLSDRHSDDVTPRSEVNATAPPSTKITHDDPEADMSKWTDDLQEEIDSYSLWENPAPPPRMKESESNWWPFTDLGDFIMFEDATTTTTTTTVAPTTTVTTTTSAPTTTTTEAPSSGPDVNPSGSATCTPVLMATCTQRATHEALEGEGPCQVLQVYRDCVWRGMSNCTEPETKMAASAIEALMYGYQANHHCQQSEPSRITSWPASENEITQRNPCAPRTTWHCTENFLSGLVSQEQSPCHALQHFRNCIMKKTRFCDYADGRWLRDGARGLVKLYHRFHMCHGAAE